MNTTDTDGNIITGKTLLEQMRLKDKLAIGLRNIRFVDSGIEFAAGFDWFHITGSVLLNRSDLYDIMLRAGRYESIEKDIYCDSLSETLVQGVFAMERRLDANTSS